MFFLDSFRKVKEKVEYDDQKLGRELKKIRQVAKNRQSAKTSRERKLSYLDHLRKTKKETKDYLDNLKWLSKRLEVYYIPYL